MRIIALVMLVLTLGLVSTQEVRADDTSGFFVHTVSDANLMTAKASVISHPLTNSNPQAMVYVTQNRTPNGQPSTAVSNTSVGVMYATTIERWVLMSLGDQNLLAGSSFNIVVEEDDANNIVHQHPPINTPSTVLNYPELNDQPEVTIMATNRVSAASGILVMNPHPFALAYDDEVQLKWFIVNQDGGVIPANAMFNVRHAPVDGVNHFWVQGFEGTLTNDDKSIILGSTALNGKEDAAFTVTAMDTLVADPSGMVAPYYLEYNQSLEKWQVTTTGDSLVGVVFHVTVPGDDQLASLVINGGFEAGSVEDNKVPANWTAKNLTNGKRKCNNPAKNKYQSLVGDCAFQLKGVQDVSSSIQQKMNVPVFGLNKNMVLVLGISGKNLTSGVKIQAVIKRADGGKGKLIIDSAEIHAGTYEYKYLSAGQIFTPEFNSAKIKIGMNSGVGKLMVDDVALHVIPIGAVTEGELIPVPAAADLQTRDS